MTSRSSRGGYLSSDSMSFSSNSDGLSPSPLSLGRATVLKSRTCALATRLRSSSHKHRWRSSRPTSDAWAGAFLGLVRAHRLQLRSRLLAHGGTSPRGCGANDGERLPPIVEHNTGSTGTDVVGYLTESPGFTRSYATTAPPTTATRRRGADWSSSWATTRSSTAHRRAATRAKRGSFGSAGTTSTRASHVRVRR
jgi:hypothetical protein